MKSSLQPFAFALFSLLLIPVFNACIPEDDLDPDTGDPREKFIGSWIFSDAPALRSVKATYTVTISNDPGNSTQVLLRNFAGAGGMYSAYGIVTADRITVPEQEMATGFIVEGSGDLTSDDFMEWEYTITAGGDMENFSASASR